MGKKFVQRTKTLAQCFLVLVRENRKWTFKNFTTVSVSKLKYEFHKKRCHKIFPFFFFFYGRFQYFCERAKNAREILLNLDKCMPFKIVHVFVHYTSDLSDTVMNGKWLLSTCFLFRGRRLVCDSLKKFAKNDESWLERFA